MQRPQCHGTCNTAVNGTTKQKIKVLHVAKCCRHSPTDRPCPAVAAFPGGTMVPDLVNQPHHMFASHQGDSLRELASVAVDNPMTSEGLVDPSGTPPLAIGSTMLSSLLSCKPACCRQVSLSVVMGSTQPCLICLKASLIANTIQDISKTVCVSLVGCPKLAVSFLCLLLLHPHAGFILSGRGRLHGSDDC